MSFQYRETAYTFETGRLVEPIRKMSNIRRLVAPRGGLMPSDLQIEIETVTDDLPITVDMEFYENNQQHQSLDMNTYDVPVISAEMQYTVDELRRINSSNLPFNQRARAMGWSMGDKEEALSFAVSSTGVKDGDNQPLLENGTAMNWDIDAYDTLKTSLGTALGALSTKFGSLKPFPLVFAMNDKAFTTINQISNANTDRSGLEHIQQQLQLYGAPGSGIMQVPNLGAALTVGNNNELSVTVEADEAVALFCVSPDHFEIFNSPVEVRMYEHPIHGLHVVALERWISRVHHAEAIQYDIDATP